MLYIEESGCSDFITLHQSPIGTLSRPEILSSDLSPIQYADQATTYETH